MKITSGEPICQHFSQPFQMRLSKVISMTLPRLSYRECASSGRINALRSQNKEISPIQPLCLNVISSSKCLLERMPVTLTDVSPMLRAELMIVPRHSGVCSKNCPKSQELLRNKRVNSDLALKTKRESLIHRGTRYINSRESQINRNLRVLCKLKNLKQIMLLSDKKFRLQKKDYRPILTLKEIYKILLRP